MLAKYFIKNNHDQNSGCGKYLNYPDLGLLLIRIGLASVFIVHGWSKIQNLDQVLGFFESMGLGIFWVFLVAYSEFLGGILMLAGVFVRQVGIVFAIIMIFSIALVKAAKGFYGGYEFELFLLLVSLSVTLIGSGKYAINCRKQ